MQLSGSGITLQDLYLDFEVLQNLPSKRESKKGSRFFLLSVVRIPFYTTFTQNSIFVKPATTNDYREKSGKVVIFKDKDNNNNIIYSKLFPIGLHFCTFLYNCLLMHVCDDVIQIALLHFTTNNTDILLKIIKR